MKSVSLLIKPVSGACNMRCRYCFYTDATDADAVMPPATLETLVKKALAFPESVCTFGFQGGEPTLAGLDFFQRFADLVSENNTRNLQVYNTLQTNGLVIDDEWASFLARNKFLTSVSIDAGKQLHDQMRPDANGKDTHNRALDATRFLTKHGVEFNVLSVVTRAMARHPDKTYRYYRERNFRHIQFSPCQVPFGCDPAASPDAPPPDLYGKFLCRIFDLWVQDFMNGDYYSIRMFDNYVHMLAGHPPEICSMAGACQVYLLVDADGSVYPCDFYAVDEYRLGDINTNGIDELLQSANARRFVESSRNVHDDCPGCEYFFLCRGGCRRDREPAVDGLPGKNIYCESYKMFFLHALPRLRKLSERLGDERS